QSLDHRRRRHAQHLHGSAGHHRRQRLPPAHCRQPFLHRGRVDLDPHLPSRRSSADSLPRFLFLSSSASFKEPAVAASSPSRKPSSSNPFPHRTAARPWASGDSASSSLPCSVPSSAAGSRTATPGAGSSTLTFPSALPPSS